MDFDPEIGHACCSAGILRYPKISLQMVRVGIMQYGHWPSTETRIEFLTKRKIVESPLRRVLSWKSHVMGIKKVKPGQFVGYGTSFQAPVETSVAIIPVGYSHGYSRSLSNQGFVLINGKRAPVIGLVNMNAFSVNINEIPETRIGDEVILIGATDDDEITVSSFGVLSRQLNYELLTRLPRSIPRVIVK